MLIYRIQNEDCKGPFDFGFFVRLPPEKYKDSIAWYGLLPGPSEDKILRNTFNKILPAEYKFACQNQDLILLWFGDFLNELIECGFHVFEINVKDYIPGEYQCLFKETDIIEERILL